LTLYHSESLTRTDRIFFISSPFDYIYTECENLVANQSDRIAGIS